mmetsp:Transcript_21375/g.46898  ORF Transcript_21375/g.46898 Transcript_21375/m.46898 type:complete len:265 (-) Transcript_21375:2859-3653(-)
MCASIFHLFHCRLIRGRQGHLGDRGSAQARPAVVFPVPQRLADCLVTRVHLDVEGVRAEVYKAGGSLGVCGQQPWVHPADRVHVHEDLRAVRHALNRLGGVEHLAHILHALCVRVDPCCLHHACVHAHPHPEAVEGVACIVLVHLNHLGVPLGGVQAELHSHAPAHRVLRFVERHVEAVTLRQQLKSVELRNGPPHQRVVQAQRRVHVLGILVPQRRAPLDVRHDDCHVLAHHRGSTVHHLLLPEATHHLLVLEVERGEEHRQD